ncbi:uncharacterized protein KNAG_0E04220 [Huiozyma naganishii CBS 8797]|uniref:Uncharacterized protein n=1 Tax=Huiozyma naganishii (strain ATCC MYA-139 / BCRC 22969 / CBS 8797 / KCTC 17520 / NBRC 10181 / NCYC 3082 / Yp74L-3) TaxID=1071383 RepID=J7R737_HUIN7|nr:hypothetical protein KNAG_0E04220 [Kazachstania naganishii CBS 8797]CCK70675.1 hypothetical protein KNAG_0E04220 [Kazachstania naganishii CBS 8797]
MRAARCYSERCYLTPLLIAITRSMLPVIAPVPFFSSKQNTSAEDLCGPVSAAAGTDKRLARDWSAVTSAGTGNRRRPPRWANHRGERRQIGGRRLIRHDYRIRTLSGTDGRKKARNWKTQRGRAQNYPQEGAAGCGPNRKFGHSRKKKEKKKEKYLRILKLRSYPNVSPSISSVVEIRCEEGVVI